VSCSVCHQIAKDKLGSPESFNGGFVVNPPASKGEHPEYGPLQSTTVGSALCILLPRDFVRLKARIFGTLRSAVLATR